jgi:hypothetical protein
MATVEKTPESSDTPCCHHWLIDKPNGALSHGICKHCGAERDFANIPPVFHGNSYDRTMAAARREFYMKKLLPDPRRVYDVL